METHRQWADCQLNQRKVALVREKDKLLSMQLRTVGTMEASPFRRLNS